MSRLNSGRRRCCPLFMRQISSVPTATVEIASRAVSFACFGEALPVPSGDLNWRSRMTHLRMEDVLHALCLC
jgi:hypothetical protein